MKIRISVHVYCKYAGTYGGSFCCVAGAPEKCCAPANTLIWTLLLHSKALTDCTWLKYFGQGCSSAREGWSPGCNNICDRPERELHNVNKTNEGLRIVNGCPTDCPVDCLTDHTTHRPAHQLSLNYSHCVTVGRDRPEILQYQRKGRRCSVPTRCICKSCCTTHWDMAVDTMLQQQYCLCAERIQCFNTDATKILRAMTTMYLACKIGWWVQAGEGWVQAVFRKWSNISEACHTWWCLPYLMILCCQSWTAHHASICMHLYPSWHYSPNLNVIGALNHACHSQEISSITTRHYDDETFQLDKILWWKAVPKVHKLH